MFRAFWRTPLQSPPFGVGLGGLVTIICPDGCNLSATQMMTTLWGEGVALVASKYVKLEHQDPSVQVKMKQEI